MIFSVLMVAVLFSVFPAVVTRSDTFCSTVSNKCLIPLLYSMATGSGRSYVAPQMSCRVWVSRAALDVLLSSCTPCINESVDRLNAQVSWPSGNVRDVNECGRQARVAAVSSCRTCLSSAKFHQRISQGRDGRVSEFKFPQ